MSLANMPSAALKPLQLLSILTLLGLGPWVGASEAGEREAGEREAEQVLTREFLGGDASGITSVGPYTLITTGSINTSFWSSLGGPELTTRIDIPIATTGSYRDAVITSPRAINANQRRYFPVTRLSGPFDLWATDGTTAGTTRVVDGTVLNLVGSLQELAAIGDTLAMINFVSGQGQRLMLLDPKAPGGAVVIPDFEPYTVDAGPHMAAFQGALYVSSTQNGDRSLWRLDIETRQLTQVWLMDDGGTNRRAPSQLTVVNGALYFRATDNDGPALWRLNASGSGASRLFDPSPNEPDASSMRNALKLMDGGNRLFFFSLPFDPDLDPPAFRNRTRLAQSQGSSGQTSRVWVEALGDGFDNVMNELMVVRGNELIFRSRPDADEGRQWWLSGGTEASTQRLLIDGQPVDAAASLTNRIDAAADEYNAWVTNDGGGVRDQLIRIGPNPEQRYALSNELRFTDNVHAHNGQVWFTSARPGTGQLDVYRYCPDSCPGPFIFRDGFKAGP